MKQGCGKEVLGKEGYSDYNCGDDFPDDDGNPWVAYCSKCPDKTGGKGK